MTNSCLLGHKVIQWLNFQRAGKKFHDILKLDLNKAYDKIDWGFLLKVLGVMGFPPCWLTRVRVCISFVFFLILVNGVPTSRFILLRGSDRVTLYPPFLFV